MPRAPLAAGAAFVCAAAVLAGAQSEPQSHSPSSSEIQKAVEEFKKALDLAPDSARERLNYGLALLRDGKTKDDIAKVFTANGGLWANPNVVSKLDQIMAELKN